MIHEAANDPAVAKIIDGDLESFGRDLLDYDITARFANMAKTLLGGYELYERSDFDAVFVIYVAKKIEAARDDQA